MSCNCHGKSGISVSRTSPYDQCSACAKKHTVKAWNMFEHRDTALLARNLAILIEENRDAEIGEGWNELLEAVRSAFRNDHPECADRLVQLENQKETS